MPTLVGTNTADSVMSMSETRVPELAFATTQNGRWPAAATGKIFCALVVNTYPPVGAPPAMVTSLSWSGLCVVAAVETPSLTLLSVPLVWLKLISADEITRA